MACAERYENCIYTRCCSNPGDGCYRRPERLYAQCRPLGMACDTHLSGWLCPCWSIGCAPPSPPIPPAQPPAPLAPRTPTRWESNPSLPFSEPFAISARDSAIWIAPLHHQQPGATSSATRLHLRGTSWSGMQEHGCVHELWKHSVAQYLTFLESNRFNAVRLPLSASLIASNPLLPSGTCGEYAGWRMLAALDSLLSRLQDIGVFVVLDMHTLSGGNTGYWCGTVGPCNEANEAPLRDAWATLATRYCHFPNVIGADVSGRDPPSSTSLSTSITLR